MMVYEAGPLGVNTVLIQCKETGEAAVFDPGGMTGEIRTMLENWEAHLRSVRLTHAHFDHIWEADNMIAYGRMQMEKRNEDPNGFEYMLHANDEPVFQSVASHGRSFGIRFPEPQNPISRWMEDQQVVAIGKLSMEVLHTPGHSPGSSCFYFESEGLLLAGDTLFAGGVGRTDLPGGNSEQLKKSIQERLFPLPESTIVIPGHGEFSSIGYEKEHNPFIRDWNFL